MTKHMIRLLLEPPIGEADQAVNQWVQNHNEWADDPVSHSLTETTAEIDGPGTTYVRGDYRFYQDTPATSLLDDLETRLQGLQGGVWYRIGYHVCPHDDPDTRDSVTKDWTAQIDTPVELSHRRLAERTLTVLDDETERTGYSVDPAYGTLIATSDGDLIDGQTYTVEYDYWASGGPCFWNGPETDKRENGTIPSDIPTL